MALDMQRACPQLTEKFEKLKFFVNMSLDMSSSSNASTPQSPLPPRTPNSATDFHCEIRAIREGDEEAVLQHLRMFFFRDEPLNLDVKLLENENSTCLELEEYSVKSIQDGLSVMAIMDDGKVVGVCLNSLDKRSSSSNDDEEECSNVKFNKIIKLLDYVDREARVFDHFPEIDRLVNVKILSVDSNMRGKGIAQLLMDQTRNNARQEGIKLMRVDCSSEYSAKAVQRLGFHPIYSLPYNEYKVNGELVFNPENPHTCVRVFVQQIDSAEDRAEKTGDDDEKKN